MEGGGGGGANSLCSLTVPIQSFISNCSNFLQRPQPSSPARLPNYNYKMAANVVVIINRNIFKAGRPLTAVRATSHLNVRLTVIRVTANDVSSYLCKILTIIMVRTYLQTGPRHYRITQHLVLTCYNSAKPPETSKCALKRPKTHSFSAGRTRRNGHYN